MPKSLYRYAAILSHGLNHVSTGGMVSIVNMAFTTYGFTNYSKKNNPQGNFRPPQGKIPEAQYPFQKIWMDFIELTPCEGKKYCLVIIDMFSKWTEVFPTKHQDALTVAKALTRDIIPRFGIPEIMYSDSGTHFVNQVIHHLALVFGISVKNHCAYQGRF